MKSLNNQWFTEVDSLNGSALGFEITEKLAEITSEYQHIEIYATKKFGNLMVIDGFVMLTSRDNFLYHEMLAHPVLFTHQDPKNIAIIGGGDCGTLQQVLKHININKVTQIDIDINVTKLAEQYFPELCLNNNDPRAKLLFADGIDWIKKQRRASLDIIIVDSTEPVGPGEGLFDINFYKNCSKALSKDGLLVQQSESPMFHDKNILLPMRKKMLASGFNAVQTLLFPQPCYPSGWWSCTMAAKSYNFPDLRINNIINKAFSTKYYNLAVHSGALAIPEYLKIQLGI